MFNWVHSKFHYNPLKDGNAWRKNTESSKKEAKTQGLAKQEANEMVDILDDLGINNNGRRLTILLMGFERSSKPTNFKSQYFNLKKKLGNEDEIVDYDDDDDMWPLMATTFLNNFDDNGEFSTQFEKSQVVVAIERHVAQRFRRRVTLADLLKADSDGFNLKPAVEKVAVEDLVEKLPEVKTAGGSCFSKKVKVAAEPPARNLRRLMRKMRKRKIHAEVDHQQLLGQKTLIINHHNLYAI